MFSHSVTGVVDLNVAVINPYVGGLGDMMTMVEPSIAQAIQDIENSSFLPGFRLNAYLVAAWLSAWLQTQNQDGIVLELPE